MPTESHQPNLRSFTESHGSNHGLQDGTPYDYFSLFFDEDFYVQLAHETNLYAALRQPPDTADPNEPYNTSYPSWRPTSAEEMKAFLGINILMGIIDLPEYADYFSSDPLLHVEQVSRVFTKNRWELLCRFLHVTSDDPNSTDKLKKLRPLIDVLSNRFAASRTPGQRMSLDEGMVKYNGRLGWKQYNQSKPDKWGMKILMLNDPDDGYCFKFHIYTGAGSVPDPTESGQGYASVMLLTEDYLHCDRVLYLDNYYNSVKLAADLLDSRTYICGTARKNRVPGIVSAEVLPRGSMRHYRNSEKTILVCHWHDKRDVYIISTNGNTDSTEIEVYRNRERASILRPDVVGDYNRYMGGTDRFDQLKAYYTVGRTGRKWWRYLFFALINFSIVNAKILWAEHQPPTTNSRLVSLKKFKLELVRRLIGTYSCRRRATIINRPTAEVIVANYTPSHSFVKFADRKRVCVGCKELNRTTQTGRRIETVYGCSGCCQNLCRDCFYRKH